MNRHLCAVVVLLSLSGTMLSACKKDKDTSPDNNNNNQTQEPLYVRATVNGKIWEYSEKDGTPFPGYGIGSSSDCNNGESGVAIATFSFEGSNAFEDIFSITLSRCTNKSSEEVENDCGEMTDWLQHHKSFPFEVYTYTTGYAAEISIKDPATGKVYAVRYGHEEGGSVTITSVKSHGSGTYMNPKFIITGTFQGKLVYEKADMEEAKEDYIRISDGAFRIKTGVCPMEM